MANFDDLTQGLLTKSDKIRALARDGVPTADIARYLGIRYQHARNVLMAAKLYRPATSQSNGAGFAEQAPAAQLSPLLPEWLEIAADGSVKLPKAFLAAADLRPGANVMLSLGDEGLELLSEDAALRRSRGILRKYVPAGVSLVDELIAGRRSEARLDNEGR